MEQTDNDNESQQQPLHHTTTDNDSDFEEVKDAALKDEDEPSIAASRRKRRRLDLDGEVGDQDEELLALPEEEDEAENGFFEPFTEEEAKQLQENARVKEHFALKTPILKLFHAFSFPLPEECYELPEIELWPVFARMLRRFCMRRKKLPDINTFEDVAQLIESKNNIVVLTGAGISVSCGIPDFRSSDGLYAHISERFPQLDDPQLLFDINFFHHLSPLPFFQMAKDIWPTHFTPSPTHRFIKLLEQKGKLLRNYTQNIDTLEKKMDIERVVFCHGSFETATCSRCRHQVPGEAIRERVEAGSLPMCNECTVPGDSLEIIDGQDVVLCNPSKERENEGDDEESKPLERLPILKPDITFFGENLSDRFDRAVEEDQHKIDLLLVIGSSLQVAPVSDLVGFFPHNVPVVLINREVVKMYEQFDACLLGFCDDVVKSLCDRLEWELPPVPNAPSAPTNGTSEQKEGDEEEERIVQFVEPNITLFEGAVFDSIRFQRFVEGYDTSSESESGSSADEADSEIGEEDETEPIRQTEHDTGDTPAAQHEDDDPTKVDPES